jgi:ubiquitin carboxyl-terminal hydrolase 7
MLVDDYEQYTAEKTDVVVVSRSASDEPDSTPTADDRTFFVASPSRPKQTNISECVWVGTQSDRGAPS